MGPAQGHANQRNFIDRTGIEMPPAPRSQIDSGEMDTRRHLFYETSHSPSLAELVGYDRIGEITDFCFIANPYYPTPDMLKHLQDHLPSLIKSYPSCNPDMSRRHLAKVIHVNPDHLLIGNGATELISIVCRNLIRTVGIAVPTFGEYLHKLKTSRAVKLYRLKPEQNYQLRLAPYLAWLRQNGLKAALIINPANPTGQFHPLEEMREFMTSAQDMDLVIVDESFIDFAGDPIPSLLTCADEFPNLLVVRSMSKHCGVAGLRLGYCYSVNEKFRTRLRKALPTWNINTLAEYFLSLLPDTDAEYQEARKRVMEDIRELHEGLKDISGLAPYPTGANFVLARIQGEMTSAQLQDVLLKEHRMYVRDCSNKVGMDGCHVRIATQGREKNQMLIEALRDIFA